MIYDAQNRIFFKNGIVLVGMNWRFLEVICIMKYRDISHSDMAHDMKAMMECLIMIISSSYHCFWHDLT